VNGTKKQTKQKIQTKLTLLASLASADFFLFPRLNSIIKGARFAGVAEIQERVTVVLRSLRKEAFADNFQKLYERCQNCVVEDGDYFEGQ
jgi:hypothetical protein